MEKKMKRGEVPVLCEDGEWRYPTSGAIAGKRLSMPVVEVDGETGETVDQRQRVSVIYRYGSQVVYTGWKAIALGLGVSQATARKYHEVFGMPVVRLVGKRVFTTQGAIDGWITRLSQVERRIIRRILEEGHGKQGQNMPKRYRLMEERLAQEAEQGGGGDEREEGSAGEGHGAFEGAGADGDTA